eukprot:TRINITY_DN4067_c0_g1_i1.p1 TRINITY_DN4067_c0_g1~~TRINITY_DN4067_c0_g1_i1.p1  ORF type:complete len:877 (-),score=185.18 TRINITY_DN4067_c0_g1_i1:219-2849(-)
MLDGGSSIAADDGSDARIVTLDTDSAASAPTVASTATATTAATAATTSTAPILATAGATTCGAAAASPGLSNNDRYDSRSKLLAEALTNMLKPLALDHALELSRADDQQSVHITRRNDGLHRQELCFIRLEEAPPKPIPKVPPKSVRIGGGYYIPELERAAVQNLSAEVAATAKARTEKRHMQHLIASGGRASPALLSPRSAEETGGDAQSRQSSLDSNRGGRRLSAALQAGAAQSFAEGGSGSSSTLGSSSENGAAGFAHGKLACAVGEDVYAAGYHYGTFTRGEVRNVRGDRRTCAGKKGYSKSIGPPPNGDAAFRVLSSDRRQRQRAGSLSTRPGSAGRAVSKEPVEVKEPSWYGPGAEALDSLLEALGLDIPCATEDEKVPEPDVYRTECCVGGKWRVELCYMSADRNPEKVVEREVKVVQKVPYPVEVEVPAPRPASFDEGCQTTERFCAHCGAPGHVMQDCPLLRLQAELRAAQNRKETTPCCQLCGAAVHLAPECPLFNRKPKCKDAVVQTEPQCQLCNGNGHMAPQCPLLTKLLKDYAGDGKASRVRVGGGWLIAPEVPGLSDGNLDEVEALRALAAAHAAGHLAQDGSVTYGDLAAAELSSQNQHAMSMRLARPKSAPPGGRKALSPRRGSRPSTPQVSNQRRSSARLSVSSSTFAPEDKSRLIHAGQMGPERFKRLEQERSELSQRIRDGKTHSPDSRPRGYLMGTFVQNGSNNRNYSHDRGSRAAFRVLRSRITKDATVDPQILRKSGSAQSLAADEDIEEELAELSAEDEVQYAGHVSSASLCDCSHGHHGSNCNISCGIPRPPMIKVVPPGASESRASTRRPSLASCDASCLSEQASTILPNTSCCDISNMSRVSSARSLGFH